MRARILPLFVMQHAKTRLFSLKLDFELLFYSTSVSIFINHDFNVRPQQSKFIGVSKCYCT